MRRLGCCVAAGRPADCREASDAVAADAAAGLGCARLVALHVAEQLAVLLAPLPLAAAAGVQEGGQLSGAAAVEVTAAPAPPGSPLALPLCAGAAAQWRPSSGAVSAAAAAADGPCFAAAVLMTAAGAASSPMHAGLASQLAASEARVRCCMPAAAKTLDHAWLHRHAASLPVVQQTVLFSHETRLQQSAVWLLLQGLECDTHCGPYPCCESGPPAAPPHCHRLRPTSCSGR